MIFIIGGNGFVGQAIGRLCVAKAMPFVVITRENYTSYANHSCDVLINANGNSKKFLADREPVAEFDASVTSVVRSLADFKADRYVLLSSGDVYPRQDRPEITREDAILDTAAMSRYGLHKYMAETIVRSTHPASLVMRMGGFVGPGMRKNAIFDMLNDQPLWLDAESRLQFIGTDTAAALIWSLIERGVVGETVNLGARGTVRIGDIYDRLRPAATFSPEARNVAFEISIEKLAALTDREIPLSTAEVDSFLKTRGR